MDDVKALRSPDVYKEVRTHDRIKGAELFQKELRGEVPVIGWIEGPLAESCDLAGLGNMLMFLMTDPGLCHLLMDKCVKTAKDFAKADEIRRQLAQRGIVLEDKENHTTYKFQKN